MLTFGRELPTFESQLLTQEVSEVRSHGEYAAKVRDASLKAIEIAHEVWKVSAAKAKTYYNRNKRPPVYTVGDRMLIFTPRIAAGNVKKWTRCYQTHGTVTKSFRKPM